MAGAPPLWTTRANAAALRFTDKHHAKVDLEMSSFGGPAKNLWVLSDAARLKGHRRDLLRDPVDATLTGTAFAWSLLPGDDQGAGSGCSSRHWPVHWRAPHKMEVLSQDSPQRGRSYERLAVAPVEVPIYRDIDVLVVGGRYQRRNVREFSGT